MIVHVNWYSSFSEIFLSCFNGHHCVVSVPGVPFPSVGVNCTVIIYTFVRISAKLLDAFAIQHNSRFTIFLVRESAIDNILR